MSYFIFAATISDRSFTLCVAPRVIAFLHSGQAVTMVSAPALSRSSATLRAMVSCCESLMAVLASDEPQHNAFLRECDGSSNFPMASITARGSSYIPLPRPNSQGS